MLQHSLIKPWRKVKVFKKYNKNVIQNKLILEKKNEKKNLPRTLSSILS